MADLRVKTPNALCDEERPFDGNIQFQKILRYGDAQLKEMMDNSLMLV